MPCQRDGYVGAILVIALLDSLIKSENDRFVRGAGDGLLPG